MTRKRAREQLDTSNLLAGLIQRYHIHSWVAPFIQKVEEVKPDGHCGFRAISVALGRDQDDWAYIRQKMEDTLEMHPTLFTDRNVPDETRVQSLARLQTRRPNVVNNKDLWLTMPGWGGVIATTFDRPVIYFDAVNGGQTALPYLTAANNNTPIVLAFTPQHFCSLVVDLTEDFPAPKIDGLWRKLHSSEASDWMEVWGPLIKIGTEVWLSHHQKKTGKTRTSKRNKKIPSPEVVSD